MTILAIVAVGCSLLFLLNACSAFPGATVSRAIDQQTPIVMAGNGGTAELQILACPKPENAAATERAFYQLLNTLNTAGLLVSGENATAKLIINLCAGPP